MQCDEHWARMRPVHAIIKTRPQGLAARSNRPRRRLRRYASATPCREGRTRSRTGPRNSCYDYRKLRNPALWQSTLQPSTTAADTLAAAAVAAWIVGRLSTSRLTWSSAVREACQGRIQNLKAFDYDGTFIWTYEVVGSCNYSSAVNCTLNRTRMGKARLGSGAPSFNDYDVPVRIDDQLTKKRAVEPTPVPDLGKNHTERLKSLALEIKFASSVPTANRARCCTAIGAGEHAPLALLG